MGGMPASSAAGCEPPKGWSSASAASTALKACPLCLLLQMAQAPMQPATPSPRAQLYTDWWQRNSKTHRSLTSITLQRC